MNILRNFMFEHVYIHSAAKMEETKVDYIIDLLFKYYKDHPELLPEHIRENIDEDGIDVCIGDHIAGMTDKYCITMFNSYFIPKNWDML